MEINGEKESEEFFREMFNGFWPTGEATWLGINPCKEIPIPDKKDVDILELHNAIHNYREQAKKDREENEQLSQELGKEKLLNKDLQNEVGMLNDTESGNLFDAKRNLKIIRKLCAKREEENKILGDKLDYEASLRGKREKEINLLHGDIVNENNEVKALTHRNELLAKENWKALEERNVLSNDLGRTMLEHKEEVSDLNEKLKFEHELRVSREKENWNLVMKLRAVESVWQTRLQKRNKSANNKIIRLESDKARLYRELKLMSELLEDRTKSANNRTEASEAEVVRLRKVLEDVKAQLSYAVAQRDYAEKEMKKDKKPMYDEIERVSIMLQNEEDASDRLEKEVDRLKGVLEDKAGLLAWHITRRGLQTRNYDKLAKDLEAAHYDYATERKRADRLEREVSLLRPSINYPGTVI